MPWWLQDPPARCDRQVRAGLCDRGRWLGRGRCRAQRRAQGQRAHQAPRGAALLAFSLFIILSVCPWCQEGHGQQAREPPGLGAPRWRTQLARGPRREPRCPLPCGNLARHVFNVISFSSKDLQGVLLINVKSYFNATWFLLLAVLYAPQLHTMPKSYHAPPA